MSYVIGFSVDMDSALLCYYVTLFSNSTLVLGEVLWCRNHLCAYVMTCYEICDEICDV
jgi:hypothetical protein